MRNLSQKHVSTMIFEKISWRNLSNQDKGSVIGTRLIFRAVFPAVKKHAIQRGSVRTICLCKWPNRTAREGRNRSCFQFQPAPLPGRHTIYILPIPILIAVPAHALAVKNTGTQFQQKEDAAPKAASSYNYLDLYLSISSRILKSCSCSSCVLAERNS